LTTKIAAGRSWIEEIKFLGLKNFLLRDSMKKNLLVEVFESFSEAWFRN